MWWSFVRAGLAAAWIGVAFSSSALRADAPPSRYVVDADTVTDTKTTLVWERSPEPTVKSYTGAQSYCANLTLAGGGWRLPAFKELLTLVDPTRYEPAIDAGAFPDMLSTSMSNPARFYWTKSALTTIVGLRVWVVVFRTGETVLNDASAPLATRCVR